MNITDSTSDGITVLQLAGRFDANTAIEVDQHIKGLIEKGQTKIILDLAMVPYVASAGLRVVLSQAKALRQQYEGDLLIVAMQPNVGKVFEISGLNNVLRIYDDVASAKSEFVS